MNKLSTLLFTLVALFAQATVKAQSDADVYKVTPILTENFDHFVNGTYDEPDAIDLATGKDGADFTPETTGFSKPIADNGARAWVENGILRIVNPAAEAVTVFTTGGRQLFADRSASHDLSITLPAHGLFIVKVGQHTVKVAK